MTTPLDVGGAALTLRSAAVALGHATLRSRAGDHIACERLIADALHAIVVSEAELQAIAKSGGSKDE